jgi:hypothetical protein
VSRDYYQFAYVTNDIDRAMEEIAAAQGIGGFMEMRDNAFPTGADRQAVCHFALAYKGDLQFELIQPLAEDVGMYRQALPQAGYATVFHHLGRHFDARADFAAALAQARSKWPIPAGYDTLGGVYAYADARKDLGHHLEFFCFPEGSHLDAVPRY